MYGALKKIEESKMTLRSGKKEKFLRSCTLQKILKGVTNTTENDHLIRPRSVCNFIGDCEPNSDRASARFEDYSYYHQQDEANSEFSDVQLLLT